MTPEQEAVRLFVERLRKRQRELHVHDLICAGCLSAELEAVAADEVAYFHPPAGVQ